MLMIIILNIQTFKVAHKLVKCNEKEQILSENYAVLCYLHS